MLLNTSSEISFYDIYFSKQSQRGKSSPFSFIYTTFKRSVLRLTASRTMAPSSQQMYLLPLSDYQFILLLESLAQLFHPFLVENIVYI